MRGYLDHYKLALQKVNFNTISTEIKNTVGDGAAEKVIQLPQELEEFNKFLKTKELVFLQTKPTETQRETFQQELKKRIGQIATDFGESFGELRKALKEIGFRLQQLEELDAKMRSFT